MNEGLKWHILNIKCDLQRNNVDENCTTEYRSNGLIASNICGFKSNISAGTNVCVCVCVCMYVYHKDRLHVDKKN